MVWLRIWIMTGAVLLACCGQAQASTIAEFSLSDMGHQDLLASAKIVSNTDLPAERSATSLQTWYRQQPEHPLVNPMGDSVSVLFFLHNDTSDSQFFVYPSGSIIEHVTISTYTEDGLVSRQQSGYSHDNPIDYHYGAALDVPPGERILVHVDFRSDYFTSPIRLEVSPLASRIDQFELENLVLVMSLGVCVALAIYNFFLFGGTRSPQYLFYALSTLGFTGGWAFTFGVPNRFLGIEQPQIAIVCFFVGLMCAAMFSSTFLQLKQSGPKLHRCILWIIVAAALCIPMSLSSVGLGVLIVSIFSILILFVSLFAGIAAWRRGYRPARYFVVALMSVLIPNLIGNLMNLNLLPGLGINAYLFAQLGNSMDSLLLAFALAEKVRLINRRNQELTEALEHNVQRRTRQLQDANTQLQEANKSKDHFLATISHEIRTPLTAIIGYADNLQGASLSQLQREEYANVIAQNSRHLLAVINDILDLSKIEANKLHFESVAVSLPAILAQIDQMCLQRAQDKGIHFSLECHYPLPLTITSDPTRLRQILFNLTNNALKFTDQGSVTLEVSYHANTLTLTVADTGIGMDESQIAKAFRPFEQGDESITRRYGGTGLGLSITQLLVQGMQGHIEVNSAPNQGTRIAVTLPVTSRGELAHSDTHFVVESTRHHSSDHQALRFTRQKVLLAEDNPHIRTLARQILQAMDLLVITANNGQQALDMYTANQDIALLLLDIQMPDFGGIETLKRLRRNGCIAPAVAFTANHMAHEVEQYLAQGFAGYVGKPIVRSQLAEVLQDHLHIHTEQADVIETDERQALVSTYLVTLQQEVRDITHAASVSDWDKVASLSHGIKGSAASFCLDTMSDIAAQLENAVREKHLDKAQQWVTTLQQKHRIFQSWPVENLAYALVQHQQVSLLSARIQRFYDSLPGIQARVSDAAESGDNDILIGQAALLLSSCKTLQFRVPMDLQARLQSLQNESSEQTRQALTDTLQRAVQHLQRSALPAQAD